MSSDQDDNAEKLFEKNDQSKSKSHKQNDQLPSDQDLLSDDSEDLDQDDGDEDSSPKKRKGDRLKQKSKEKRLRRGYEDVQDFYDDMADQSDNDEQDDDDGESGEPGEREQANRLRQQHFKPRNNGYIKDILEGDEEDINQRYRQKGRYYNNDNEGSFPAADDPKTFIVPVKKGREDSLTLAILNKASMLKNDKDKRLKIFSVTSLRRKFNSYIFIEAKNEKAVKHALEGLQDIYLSKVEEMKPEQYEMLFKEKQSTVIDLQKDQYVRIKGGVYDGDLGKVTRVKKNGVDVNLVPRINLQEFDSRVKDVSKKYEGKEELPRIITKIFKRYTGHRQPIDKKNRPPKKLLPPSITQMPDIPEIPKLKFSSDGLISLSFTFNEINRLIGTISSKELEVFKKDAGQAIGDFANQEIQNLVSALNVIKGDMVEVVSGDTQGIYGTVTQVKTNTVMIARKRKGGQIQYIEEPIEKLAKRFQISQRVKVVAGNDKGKTGTILKIENRLATIFTQNENQIVVNTNNLTLAKGGQTVQDDDSREDFKKYELIKIQNNVGIILAHIKNNLKILDLTNSIKSISVLDFDSRIDTRHNIGKNSYGQMIKNGAIVRINTGPNAGKRCQVKHVYKDYLFLYNCDLYQTSSIAVEKVTNCTMVTAGTQFKRTKPQYGIHAVQNPKQSFKRQQKPDDELQIGKSITIKGGMYKGYQGVIINNNNPNTIMVKLTAKGKTVHVNKDDILAVKKTMDIGKTPRLSGSTYGPQSPAVWNESRHDRNDDY